MYYSPFGLNMEGPWAAQYQKDENGETLLDQEGNPVVDQTKLNRYQYNGKELTQDLDLNWYSYGARYYDPAIARFTGVDPISDQFPHVSTYNYAENSPIANIDLHGLQAFFAADGRLLGYHVKRNQGPTQISQDLRDQGYSISWTSIVDNNKGYFAHISERRYDKYNEAYTALNMNERDYIDLSFFNSQYQRSGVGDFSGSGAEIYNESLRIVRQATFQDENKPYRARDLIGVNPFGGGLATDNSSTTSRLSDGFSQRSGSIYDGAFINEKTGVGFRLTLQDGGNRAIGTPYMGIYGNIRRSRAPSQAELGHDPYAYTVTLPIASGGFGSTPLILRIGFRNEEDRNQFFNTATTSSGK